MNKLTKKSFFSRTLSGEKSDSTHKSPAKPQPVAYEVFKEHWKQANLIFNKSLINDDDIQIVKNNINQMINLLLDELNNPNNYLSLKPLAYTNLNSSLNSSGADVMDYGPIWNYLFHHNIFEVFYLWSLSYPEYLFDLKYEQLKYYENLVYQMQTNEQTHLLLSVQIHQPLFSLLNHCSTHNSEQIEKLMISILNQLCVCICKNSELLEIFFQQAKSMSKSNSCANFYLNDSLNGSNSNDPYKFTTHFSTNKQYMQPTSSARFFIFSLLIPYIHKEGAFGQQARDALLMIMQLSMRNSNLAKYIVDSTDFCPILATGLSGLYSELPQKLTSNENFDEIRYLKKDDVMNIPSLNKFINSLEFCNNVIQVSHSLIANQLLQYVYYGFLVPVIAPALTQNCVDEIIAATAYLDLFLRTVNEPNLRKIFLKFILYAKFDERVTLLDTLVSRINSNTKLSLVTLMLFYTMVDFNSEDVMYKLILIYLLPCNHLMKSQISTLKQSSHEINGSNANTFLSLATTYDKQVWLESVKNNLSYNGSLSSVINQKEPSSFSRWFYTLFETTDMNNTIAYLDGSHFNYADYLKDAQQGISNSTQISLKWSYFYDASNYLNDTSATNSDSSQTKNQQNKLNRPSHELDYDAEEYLLNLNIFASSLSDPIKSTHNTQNIFESSLDYVNECDSNSNANYRRDSITSDKPSENEENLKKPKRKLKKSNRIKTSMGTQDFSTNKENTSSVITKIDSENKLKKRQRSRQKRRERASDFYFLSFDNELSDSESSVSLSDNDEDQSNTPEIKTNQIIEQEADEDEEDFTNSATSRSSSVTLNNETTSLSSAHNQDDLDLVNSEYRQQLIEYLFVNEENNKQFLNGNLNNFLGALDAFFAKNKYEKMDNHKNSDLTVICDQIMNIYNDLFTLKTHSINSMSNAKYEENAHKESGRINEIGDAITHFPTYTTDSNSMHSSTHSMNENIDSGCVVESSASSVINNNVSGKDVYAEPFKETDIGPFMTAIFGRLDHMLSNPLQINFLLTGILARLAYYPQLLLRSYLLNHDLVVQSNVKTLIQVMSNVKYKIDACSQSFNNFPLLYFRAKVCLVKRIVDSKTKPVNSSKRINQAPKVLQEPVKSIVQIKVKDNPRKKSTFDRFIDFFKTEEEKQAEFNTSLEAKKKIEIAETEFNDGKVIFNPIESSGIVKYNNDEYESNSNSVKEFSGVVNDFTLVENEWENLESRNIAYSAVIFDEFVKELAAICQEHGLSTHDL